MNNNIKIALSTSIAAFLTLSAGCNSAADLTDKEIDNVVRRSYQYVAMFNTNNNFAMQEGNPLGTGGWNKMFVPESLADHTLTAIPRPNNDTLYLISMLDLRDDAVVIEFPAFDSKYVSLETSAYDHFIDVPLSTTKGDFKDRTTMLFYTERTKNYKGRRIKGIDKSLKMTGDFAIAFLRVAPHASEPERMKRNIEAMKSQKLMTLSEFQGKTKKPTSVVKFPAFSNDQAVFRNNFLEAMQFIFNHTTFDPEDEMDKEVLAALKPLGVAPGRQFDADKVAGIDGEKFARVAEEVLAESLKIWNDPQGNPYLTKVFQPKGKMTIEPMVVQSAVGPIGLPFDQAQYPGIGTTDGQPINAKGHYVIKMSKEQLPPARAFWSATLYDAKKGLFIPNDNYKYSVGENGGMKLDESGGLEIHISPEQPEGVPTENWLPSGGKDENLDVIMRVYAPDIEKMEAWKAPRAVEEEATPLWAHVPETISPEWGAFFQERGQGREAPMPAPDDIEGWKAVQAANDEGKEPSADEKAAAFGVTYKKSEIAGIPVIEVTPSNLVRSDKIAVYTHGGAYVLNSARAVIEAAMFFAAETRLRVIAVDYTLAPHSKWRKTTNEVVNVFTALAQQGFKGDDIVLYGDSAGGGLAASVTLKMRDLGMEMPAALVLWSPWADISETGDTYVTLRDAEPYYTYEYVLGPSALAYADAEDHKNPYVSPVYGDFKKGFPPTLIQGGTKELFLSNVVRLYQAIDQAGQTVKLDIHEGMPHVFVPSLPKSIESQAGMAKVVDWVSEHLLDD